MVTLSNTHTSSYNNSPSTQDTITHLGQSIMLGLSNALVSAGYLLEISCDSTQIKTDGTNTWGSTANIVWASGGSAHSYQVFKTPSGMINGGTNQLRIALMCSTGSGNPHLINVTFASAAFTNSGSVNTDPTAPTNNRAFTSQQFVQSTVANSHFHYDYVSGGTEIGNFNFQASRDTSGIYAFAFKCEAAHGNASGDNWDVFTLVNYTTSAQGALSITGFSTSHVTSVWTDGTILSTGSMYYGPVDVGGTEIINLTTSSGNNINGNFPDYPMVVCSTVASKVANRGFIVDGAFSNGGGTSVNQATLEPSTGTVTTSIIGETWIAGNAVSSP